MCWSECVCELVLVCVWANEWVLWMEEMGVAFSSPLWAHRHQIHKKWFLTQTHTHVHVQHRSPPFIRLCDAIEAGWWFSAKFFLYHARKLFRICELRLKLNFLTIQILFMYFMFGISNHCIFSKHFTRARKFSTHIERDTFGQSAYSEILQPTLIHSTNFRNNMHAFKMNIFYPFAYSLLRFIYYFQPSFVVVRMWICFGVCLFDRDLLVLLVPLVFIYLMLLSRFDEATKLLLNIKPSGRYICIYVRWATSH